MACTVGSRCQFDGRCDCPACSASTRPLVVLRASATKSDPPVPVPLDLPCTLCDCTEGADSMLICDGCERCFHLHCLVPPRSLRASGSFLCPSCDPEFINQSSELYNSKTPLVYRPKTLLQTSP